MHSQHMHMKNPCAFLNQPDAIAALMPHAERLIELREILSSLLPEPLARRCSVANCKQGRVVILASNGAIAAKLKLMLPALLEQLSGRAMEVTGLEVAVQALESEHQVPEKSAKISQQAASGLAELCEQLPDSELKTALSRIVFQHRR
ncbi:MAG TPA: DciA family protein [Burkholderiales bacterium]|nr:DciA family protein [Burkholderiales bacterium]